MFLSSARISRSSIIIILSIAAIAFLPPLAFSQTATFHLAPLFTDNMVLQQQRSVPVWGKGIPDSKIVVRASWGKTVSTVVKDDSSWMMKLPTPKAGGPFKIAFQHADFVFVLDNVLIGEVWLCSGQSNMEMPLEGWPPTDTIARSSYEIQNAQFPKIRLFHLQRNYAAEEADRCSGHWEECSPTSVRTFSATAYFFGKRLHQTLKIPVGLIEAAWGGTPVESWMSKEKLSEFGEFLPSLQSIEKCKDSLQKLERWLSQLPQVEVGTREPGLRWQGLHFDDEDCSLREFPDSNWNEMELPITWERTSLGNFDGTVWFRKSIALPSAWNGRSLTLHLGPIDDLDETYVNGVKVGETMHDGFWKVERVYTIPDSINRDCMLQVAVRVIDNQGGGGIWGDGKKLFIANDSGEQISLEGEWKYLPVAEYRAGKFYVMGGKGNNYLQRPKLPVDFSANSPTSLYNGMIHPVIPYSIKGVIWYQGESNTGDPALYSRLFPAMIADWRKAFGVGNFPFYFVQIAPFDYGDQTASQYLREAQLQTLRIANTGMAVTLDIGNPTNIHPANKMDVGRRLASWALGKLYGKNLQYSGPIYNAMKVVKEKIIIFFTHAGGGLVLKELNGEHHIVIAGEDRMFRKAKIKLDGKSLIAYHPEIKMPVAVRYAWSNTAEGTLFNKEGLPASSFRTDNWK
ncbi:MAG: sialate O-acetylesterase [bacterium]